LGADQGPGGHTLETGFHYGVIPSETGSRESGHKTHGVSTFSDCIIIGVNHFTELWLKLAELIVLQLEEPVGTGERALVKAQMRLLFFMFTSRAEEG